MTERTTTEYALWFDTDDPNDPRADIRGESSYLMAQRRAQEHADEEPDDPPKGICRREVRLIEGPWEVA